MQDATSMAGRRAKKRPAPTRGASAALAVVAATALASGARAGSVLQQKLFGLPSGLGALIALSCRWSSLPVHD